MLLERLVYILRIMTGGSHVARWCPKRTIAKCQKCSQVIRLRQIVNILYGKRCKGLIIVDQNKLTLTNIIDRYIFFSQIPRFPSQLTLIIDSNSVIENCIKK